MILQAATEALEALGHPSPFRVRAIISEAFPGWTTKQETTERMWSARSPNWSEDGIMVWARSPALLLQRIARIDQAISVLAHDGAG